MVLYRSPECKIVKVYNGYKYHSSRLNDQSSTPCFREEEF